MQTGSGCLVGFSSQVSITPTLSRGPVQAQPHVSDGSETGDRVDKFTRCSWEEGPEGLPILGNAGAWFVGRVLSRFDLGDHVGQLLEPVAGCAPETLAQLVTFADVRDLEPGHEA